MAENKKKSTTIDPGPQVTIDIINELYKTITKAIAENDQVEIKNVNIENIDLTGIQLFQYAIKTAEIQGKELKFNISFSENINSLLKSSGFQNILSI
jgi:ABC-type transporter Mla MlaB component